MPKSKSVLMLRNNAKARHGKKQDAALVSKRFDALEKDEFGHHWLGQQFAAYWRYQQEHLGHVCVVTTEPCPDRSRPCIKQKNVTEPRNRAAARSKRGAEIRVEDNGSDASVRMMCARSSLGVAQQPHGASSTLGGSARAGEVGVSRAEQTILPYR
ncbi:hypothetical protein BCR44DRAFT_1430522 [Catenaria anguillulae PL171]|uniref:Uncharacterized protein n=1 Tax=Catenaria anguillulae PL171 TaxID=765915 RepID=A0A1Y2HV10_9FUNG|nr:hypothetical protein BCR44DRAFT_1430522 [Catenaria anguillulae PL171]